MFSFGTLLEPFLSPGNPAVKITDDLLQVVQELLFIAFRASLVTLLIARGVNRGNLVSSPDPLHMLRNIWGVKEGLVHRWYRWLQGWKVGIIKTFSING